MKQKTSNIQTDSLFGKFDELQRIYGNPSLRAIYGAGQINSPSLVVVFMNPTARNSAAKSDWQGIRAPWIGTTIVWRLLRDLTVISNNTYSKIAQLKGKWNEDFALEVYAEIAKKSIYITNLAKCTQIDARPLPNTVFRQYLELFWQEMSLINARTIITFGNQVSSLVCESKIEMQHDHGISREVHEFTVVPTYYPVGQGQRNAPLMVADLKEYMATLSL